MKCVHTCIRPLEAFTQYHTMKMHAAQDEYTCYMGAAKSTEEMTQRIRQHHQMIKEHKQFEGLHHAIITQLKYGRSSAVEATADDSMRTDYNKQINTSS